MMAEAEIRLAVKRRDEIASGIFSFDLEPLDGAPLPAFKAGAHLEVALGGYVRQYSLYNAPGAVDRYSIAIKRESQGRGGSKFFCDNLHVGTVLRAKGPREHFSLTDADAPALLVAGGIGITPLLSMAGHLEAQGRPFKFHYRSRSRQAAAFVPDVLRFREKASLCFDDAVDGTSGESIDQLMAAAARDTHLYVCGPAPMIDAVVEAARLHRFTEDRIHFERFSLAPPSEGDQAFGVVVKSSGARYVVEKDETIAQVLMKKAGLPLAVSCEAGVCGTCKAGLLDGDVDHRDFVLSEEERAHAIILCCSRAKSGDLTLDL